MGERADELRWDDTPLDADLDDEDVTVGEMAEPEPTPTLAEEESPEEIRDQIEETRSDMSETIDEIQARLSPENLVEQAKGTVRDATIGKAEQVVSDATDTAKGAGMGLMETIKQNPIPAALAGIGIAWLWRNRQSAPPQQRYQMQRSRYAGRAMPYYEGDYVPAAYGRTGGQARQGADMTGQVQERVSDTASQVQSTVGGAASQVQDKAAQMTDQVQQQVGEWTDQAQQQMYEARDWFQQTLDDNPLLLGALALGAGLAVGLAVPETQTEQQMMGQARDQLMETAQTKAQQVMDKAQSVAQEATSAARQEAQEQGLTGQS